MKVRYNVVDGEIVSENRGGVKSFYVPDALGSTIAVTDNAGTVTDQISYWPYGSISSRTGSNLSPFLYCGSLGYYSNGEQIYVRARFLVASDGRWLTSDPLVVLEVQNRYNYVDGRATVLVDPSGMQPPAPVGPMGPVGTGVIVPTPLPTTYADCEMAYQKCMAGPIATFNACKTKTLGPAAANMFGACLMGCLGVTIVLVVTANPASWAACGAACAVVAGVDALITWGTFQLQCGNPFDKAQKACAKARETCRNTAE